MNKFLNYHQNCYKPGFGMNKCDSIGRHLAFFGQDSRREEPLDQPYGLPAQHCFKRSAFFTCGVM